MVGERKKGAVKGAATRKRTRIFERSAGVAPLSESRKSLFPGPSYRKREVDTFGLLGKRIHLSCTKGRGRGITFSNFKYNFRKQAGEDALY